MDFLKILFLKTLAEEAVWYNLVNISLLLCSHQQINMVQHII